MNNNLELTLEEGGPINPRNPAGPQEEEPIAPADEE